MTSIVFMHVGPDVETPALMVRSVRRSNPQARVVQVSDDASPEVEGVDEVLRRRPAHDRTMLFRTQLFAEVPVEAPTWFIDTDMLCHRELPDAGDFDAALCVREFRVDALFNPDFGPEDFSEYAGRTMGEAFPIVGCVTLVASPGFWPAVRETFEALPAKYHQWYGDQEALRIVSGSGRFRLARLPESVFACLPEHEGAEAPFFTHYKGNRKPLLRSRADAEGFG